MNLETNLAQLPMPSSGFAATCLILGSWLAWALWGGRPKLKPGDRAAIATHLSQTLQDAVGKSLGSAALILIESGEVSLSQGFGIAQVEPQASVDPSSTLYQMASVSKMVTAWGIAKLVEDEYLDWDRPVCQYLTRWHFPYGTGHDRVTVRQLLSHTAGLNDRLGYAGFLPDEPIQTLEESLTCAADPSMGQPRGVAVAWPPGKQWCYSGGGYTLLQLLVEEVTQRSFAAYMDEFVLQPLGMKSSSFDWDAIANDGRAENLATSFDLNLRPSPHRRFTATAAASLYATPDDMARFAIAYLRKNLVLTEAQVQALLQPQPGAHQDWGLGHILYLPVADERDRFLFGHDGNNLPALCHTVRINPVTGNGIVLMTSGNPNLINRLGNDWIFSETGRLTANAKFDRLLRGLIPAVGLIAVGLGAIAQL